MNRKALLPLLLVVLLGQLAACAGPQQRAARALADARAVLAAVREDAQRYQPAELAALDATVRDLDARLRGGDTDAVYAAVPALTDRLAALRRRALEQRQAHALAVEAAKVEWSALAADLPRRIGAIEARVAQLQKEKKLPEGIDRAALDAARTGVAAMRRSFTESATLATSGEAIQAAVAARALQAQAAQLAVRLGVPASP
ncbi:MAG: hypothetical protein U1F11_08975 [Steroidobacteraceae bacterium]